MVDIARSFLRTFAPAFKYKCASDLIASSPAFGRGAAGSWLAGGLRSKERTGILLLLWVLSFLSELRDRFVSTIPLASLRGVAPVAPRSPNFGERFLV